MKDKAVWSKWLVTLLALVPLSVLVARDADVSAGVVALVVVAVLPWLAPLVSRMELPGGGSVEFRDVKAAVHHVQEQVSRQAELLRTQQEIINQLVVYSMSYYQFDLLSGLHHAGRGRTEYRFDNSEFTRQNLRHLRDHGYLESFSITGLTPDADLAALVTLTPIGTFLVELRERLLPPRAAPSPGNTAPHDGRPTGAETGVGPQHEAQPPDARAARRRP